MFAVVLVPPGNMAVRPSHSWDQRDKNQTLLEFLTTRTEGPERENRERKTLGESLQRTAGRILLRKEEQPAMWFLLSDQSQGVPLGKPGKWLRFAL